MCDLYAMGSLPDNICLVKHCAKVNLKFLWQFEKLLEVYLVTVLTVDIRKRHQRAAVFIYYVQNHVFQSDSWQRDKELVKMNYSTLPNDDFILFYATYLVLPEQ